MASWTAFPAPPDRNPARFDEFPFGPGFPVVECLFDANAECRHGRLPRDPSPACGCWSGWEDAEVSELTVKAKRKKAA